MDRGAKSRCAMIAAAAVRRDDTRRVVLVTSRCAHPSGNCTRLSEKTKTPRVAKGLVIIAGYGRDGKKKTKKKHSHDE